MRLSASRINTWMTCPLQAYYKYHLKLPTTTNAKTVFGSVVHHALDVFNSTGDVPATRAAFLENWEEPELLGQRIDYWPKGSTFPMLKEKGLQIIDDFVEREKWTTARKVIASEHKFVVPFGDHELSGIVDYVEVKKAGNGKKSLRVVDLKTTTRQPRRNTLALNVQFTVYLYAVEQLEFWTGYGDWGDPIPNGEQLFEETRDYDHRGIWYHLWTGKELNAGIREDVDFMRLYRVVQQIADAEEKGVYVPKISEDSCTLCDFTDECGIEIPGWDEVDPQEAALL